MYVLYIVKTGKKNESFAVCVYISHTYMYLIMQ